MAALKLSGLFLPALVSRYHEAEHREGKPLMECLFRSLLTAIIALFGGLLFFNSSTDSEPAPIVEIAPVESTAILPTVTPPLSANQMTATAIVGTNEAITTAVVLSMTAISAQETQVMQLENAAATATYNATVGLPTSSIPASHLTATAIIAGATMTQQALTATPVPTEAAQIHWEYEGEAGPENWGALSEDFALCSEGLEQSPIDITAADAENLTDLIFNYQPSTLEIVNNGHTIQANVTPGSFLSTNTDRYELRQFHFHHPSEHTINGDPAAMELHFVHVNQEGEIAVIGVLLAIGEENRAYMPVLNSMPTAAGETMLVEASFSMESLMPQSRLYYAYSGSLTTPPCTEGVTWLLLTTPVEISAEQVEQFADIFELNARPVQDLNDREVQEDTE